MLTVADNADADEIQGRLQPCVPCTHTAKCYRCAQGGVMNTSQCLMSILQLLTVINSGHICVLLKVCNKWNNDVNFVATGESE